MKSTTKKTETIADLMAEFDAQRVTLSERRHAAFQSAQQREQRARGISRAMKLGLGLGALVVVLAVAL